MKRKKYIYDEEVFNIYTLPYYLRFYNYIYTNEFFERNENNYFVKNYYTYKQLQYYVSKYNDIVPLFNTCVYMLGISKDDMNNFNLMMRYCDNFRNREYTLRKRIEYMLDNYNCSFLTLTFDDEHLKFANDRNVKDFLKKLSLDFYVANVDYGGINHRKHYHCVISSQDIDLKLWTYGNIDIRKITYFDSEYLSHYITKLSAHSFKETCKVIYSRKKRKEIKKST